MSVKRYGIYLAFPPTVDLRTEGLGRHLAMFLKGAQALPNVHFTLVCPSWSRGALNELFQSEQVPTGGLAVLAPEGKPYALRLFEWVKAYSARPKRARWWSRIGALCARVAGNMWAQMTERAVVVHNLPTLLRFVLEAACWLVLAVPVVLVLAPVALLWLVGMAAVAVVSYVGRARGAWRRQREAIQKLTHRMLSAPEKQGWVLRLFDAMQAHEIRRMHVLIEGLSDVRAWYCPTAFWPSFHAVRGPRLMCVPDVVLSEFPAGFATIGGDLTLSTFQTVERAIRSGDHFVTYSDTVKWQTLVDRYAIPAHKVVVIPHAPNTLNPLVDVMGFADAQTTSLRYCRTLLRSALARSSNQAYTATFRNDEVKFLFYASQFRPNKNVITLLRAYEQLLRSRYIGHKLILTGHPEKLPEVGRFVREHRLENDVLFLHGLSVAELAACYKLAELAVNPTFSEGGCPFTFTEALSVGTPVVMSDIPVTREVLTAPSLQEATLFDPYDWRDCADRIEWALNHRDELLSIQMPVYRQLAERTWSHVAAEHIARLEQIALSELTEGVA